MIPLGNLGRYHCRFNVAWPRSMPIYCVHPMANMLMPQLASEEHC
jgi:hypothetical protein